MKCSLMVGGGISDLRTDFLTSLWSVNWLFVQRTFSEPNICPLSNVRPVSDFSNELSVQ
jgi:hypothetical protein